jgi:hypothetical protein
VRTVFRLISSGQAARGGGRQSSLGTWRIPQAEALVPRSGTIVVEPGEGELLADTLRRLLTDPGRVAEMGQRARVMLDAHFTRRHAFQRWRSLIEQVALSSPRIQCHTG